MDSIYGKQTAIYDLTRKYYLHGRDMLLKEIERESDGRVLEVGCGTARNLLVLHHRCPTFELYGLDASRVMLEVGERKLARRGYPENLRLVHGLAEDVSPALFGAREPFDTVFFSFSLSMIPDWEAGLKAALASLKPGGRLYVVDFGDLSGLPVPLRLGLAWWLDRFHVHHRPEAIRFLQQQAEEGRGTFDLQIFAGNYSYRVKFTKA